MSYFGNKTEEVRVGALVHTVCGSWFNCREKAWILSLRAYIYGDVVTGHPLKVKGAIYRKSDNRRVAVTEEKIFSSSFSKQWVTFKFSSSQSLDAGDYWLVLWGNYVKIADEETLVFLGYEYDEPNKGIYQDIPYNSFPKRLIPSGLWADHKYSIYCTYTTEKPLAGKGRLYVYAVADSEEVDSSFLINGEGPYDTPRTLDLTPATYTVVGSYKGQTDKKPVTIEEGDIKSVTLTFTKVHKFTIVSAPSPIDFTFNTEKQSTPFVRELVSGTYTLVMPKSWMIGLDEYVFEQWENGSRKPTRTVTLASPQEVTVTATYRLRQIDEAGPINQRQMKDTLQEVVGQGGDVSPTNPLPTEDTGTHSNPEKFVQDHKFSSWPIDRAGAVATLLYGIASPAAHRRTAGLDITLWWVYFYNHSGGAATVWLESPAGTVISATIQLADNQGVMLNVKPLDVGDEDIFVNASANLVQAQCGGVET